MRDYEEVAMSVLRRRDEQLAKDKHRRVIILKAGTAALSFCFACAIGIGAWRSGIPGELMKHGRPGGEEVIVEETSTTAALDKTDTVSGLKPTEGAEAQETAPAEQTTRTADRSSDDTAVKTPEDKTVRTTAAAQAGTTEAAQARTTRSRTESVRTTAAPARTAKTVTEAAHTSAAQALAQNAATAAVQATVPAAVQVSVPVTVQVTTPFAQHGTMPAEVPSSPAQAVDTENDIVPVTTDIDPDDSAEAMGRSEYMKKVTSFFASIMTAATDGEDGISALQSRPEARDNPYIKGVIEFAEQYSDHSGDPFSRIADGTTDADFNADGKVDEMDSYMMFWYTEYNADSLAKTVAGRISRSGDIDGNGTVDNNDTELLMKYVLINKIPTGQMFDTSYYYDRLVSCYEAGDEEYLPMIKDDKQHSEMPFVSRLYESGQSIGVTYYIFAEKADKGEFDLDFDSDGTFSIRDIIWYKIYDQKTPVRDKTDPMTGKIVKSYDFKAKINVSPGVESRIEKIRTSEQGSGDSRRTSLKKNIGGELSDVIRYYFETHDLTEKMLNNGYYDALVKGAGAYDVAKDIVWYQFYTGMISAETLDEYINGNAFQEDLVLEITDKELEKMRRAIAEGTLPQPDADANGIIDARDYWYSNIYNGDIVWGRAPWESELPLEVSTFFATQFDYDQDGKSGTERDIRLAQPYLIEKAVEAIAERMASEGVNDSYVLDVCRAAITYNVYNRDEAFTYGAYDGLDPEKLDLLFWPKLDEDYKAYKEAVRNGTASEPDLDGDGVMTENDRQIASVMQNYLLDCNKAEHGVIAELIQPDPSLVTEEVLRIIETSCDFNSDGRSGMMYDMGIAYQYVADYLWDIQHTEADKSVTITGSTYGITKECGGLPQEVAAAENGTEEDGAETADIAGDANNDAKVNVADAVTVLKFTSGSENGTLGE